MIVVMLANPQLASQLRVRAESSAVSMITPTVAGAKTHDGAVRGS